MSSNSTPIECNITSQETTEESKDFLVPTSQFNKRVNDLQKLMEPEFKRKSKIVEKFGREMSPESYRKEMSKFYSQQNRRRKKEYVTDLENKIEELEKKQIDFYRNKVFSLACGSEEQDFIDYYESRKYYRNQYIEDTLSKSNDEGIQRFKDMFKVVGPAGEARRKFIKKCFRSVIEALVPEGMRFNIILTSDMKKEFQNDYSKLFDFPPQTALAMLKSPLATYADKIYYDLGISAEMREEMLNQQEIFQHFRTELKSCVHDLIHVRNRIFKVQDEAKKFTFLRNNGKFNCQDFGKLLIYSKQVENDPIFSIYDCWGIKKKSGSEENYDEVSLTDHEI